MENRRAFLRLAVFGLASSTLAARTAVAATVPAPSPGAPDITPEITPGAAPWWLLHPLTQGAEAGLGWQISALYPAVNGAVTLNLAHADGRTARVDLCLREGDARGPASSAHVDFIVMDGGNGAAPMEESLGRVVRRLAAVVAENEERDPATIAALEPHADRVWRHAEALAAAATTLAPV